MKLSFALNPVITPIQPGWPMALCMRLFLLFAHAERARSRLLWQNLLALASSEQDEPEYLQVSPGADLSVHASSRSHLSR